MHNKQVFLLDGKGYDVHVTKLTRQFSVMDSENSGRTIDGQMYRDPVGTFYHYTMTVSAGEDTAELEAFWEAISQPVHSHVCTFPYGQQTLTQRMFITDGEQPLLRMTDRGNYWDEVTLQFTAVSPRVVP